MVLPVIFGLIVILGMALIGSFIFNRSKKSKEETAAIDQLNEIAEANKVLDITDKVNQAQQALQKRKDSCA